MTLSLKNQAFFDQMVFYLRLKVMRLKTHASTISGGWEVSLLNSYKAASRHCFLGRCRGARGKTLSPLARLRLARLSAVPHELGSRALPASLAALGRFLLSGRGLGRLRSVNDKQPDRGSAFGLRPHLLRQFAIDSPPAPAGRAAASRGTSKWQGRVKGRPEPRARSAGSEHGEDGAKRSLDADVPRHSLATRGWRNRIVAKRRPEAPSPSSPSAARRRVQRGTPLALSGQDPRGAPTQ